MDLAKEAKIYREKWRMKLKFRVISQPKFCYNDKFNSKNMTLYLLLFVEYFLFHSL